MNRNRRVRFGGLIVGHRGDAMNLGLVVSRHRWSRRCRRGCLRRLGGAETFLPNQHADQEEGQCNANHGSWRCESPMGLRWLDLVEFLEQLACVEFSVVLGPESLNSHVDALVLALPKSSASSPVQSMVFFWISIVSDSSAEIT